MTSEINIMTNRHDIAGTELVRVTTRVINPDQTGLMGHLVIHQNAEASFWSGVDAAKEAAGSLDEKTLTILDLNALIEACPEDISDTNAYGLGVKAVFETWQPALVTEDRDYVRHKLFMSETRPII